VKPTGSLKFSDTQPKAFANESSLYAHSKFQIYTSLWMNCSLNRHCETHTIFNVPKDKNISPCKWIQSLSSHYVPDVYFASGDLFPSSLLWNPQVHYWAHRAKHRPWQMNLFCRITQCSRSILRLGMSVPFLASVKPTGTLLSTQTKKLPPLQMIPVCMLILCSRSIYLFGWSVHILASETHSIIIVHTDPNTGPRNECSL
jgi:hypothetical protein